MRRPADIRDENGQTMAEFAMVLPILVLLLFGVIQFGILFNNYVTLTDAVRAGAQALPEDPGQAAALAAQYASANGGPSPQVSFSTTYLPNDTIHVQLSRPEPGFFAKVFNIDTVQIGSKAAARTGTLGSA